MANTMNERTKQERAAWAQPYVYRYHFLCDDNTTFSAIAPSQAGAWRVLNAERPGMGAKYDGATGVPCAPLHRRLEALRATEPRR